MSGGNLNGLPTGSAPQMVVCKDCVDLDLFLSSPSRQKMEFTTTGPKRKHIEDRVRAMAEISTSTNKIDRAPHTLILTKTMDWWQASHDAWSDRCPMALASFNSIGTENLKQLLGDKYDELVDMRQVKLVGPAAVAPLTSSTTGSRPNMIDLEED